jgi:hypothetical protein
MDNESQRPLIDVAREWVEASDVLHDASQREHILRIEAEEQHDVHSLKSARLILRGYDARCAEENAGFVDTLTLANQRIAELEAFIAAQDAHDHYAERDDVKSLREKVAELEARNKWLSDEVTKMHKLYGDLAASRAALGVVVDDAMVERFCRQFFANNGLWSGVHWMPSDKTRDDARNAMYAALTSATIVPLASAKPVEGWIDGSIATAYLGIEEVRDGE